MIGLFGPHRYGFETYKNYNLKRLQDNYRELSILLNRNGISNAALPLYFNGASNYFKELPKAADISENDYAMVEKLKNETI